MHTCVSPSCSTPVSIVAVPSEGLNQESRMRSVAPFLYEENFLAALSELYYPRMKVGGFTHSMTSLRAWGSALLSTGDAMGHSLGDRASVEWLDERRHECYLNVQNSCCSPTLTEPNGDLPTSGSLCRGDIEMWGNLCSVTILLWRGYGRTYRRYRSRWQRACIHIISPLHDSLFEL